MHILYGRESKFHSFIWERVITYFYGRESKCIVLYVSAKYGI